MLPGLTAHAFQLRSQHRHALHPIDAALQYHRAQAEILGEEDHGNVVDEESLLAQGKRGGAEHQIYHDQDTGRWIKRLFAIREVAKSDTGAEPGRAWLKAEVENYWSHRKPLIAILQYITRFQHSLPSWEQDANTASLLAGALENDH